MENSSSPSFTHMLNSPYTSQDPGNRNIPPQFNTSLPSSQYAQQNYYPYPSPASYHPFPYPGVFPGGQISQPQSSFVGFAGADPYGMNHSQASGFDGSSAAKSIQEEQTHQESSGSSPGEEEKEQNTKRRNWTEQENLRLVSAWLANSLDPVEGNSKKSEHYWKQVAQEYNSNTPKDRKRSSKQLRDHWSKSNKLVVLFSGCWINQKSVYASGINHKDLMDQAKAVFKNRNNKKPFKLEYWWEEVKMQPKWRYWYEENNGGSGKRGKISDGGTYILNSSRDTEETVEGRRPQGHKGAKRKLKEATKGTSSSNLQADPTMQLHHDAITIKSDARKEKASAMREYATALIEKAKTKRLSKYMKLLQTDTSSYTEAQLERHEKLVDLLSMEFFNIKD